MKRFLLAAAIMAACGSPIDAATDCSFWGFACARITAPSREAAVEMFSDFSASDIWRVGSGTAIETTPVPVTLYGSSGLNPDPWQGQSGLLSRIDHDDLPRDWFQISDFPLLRHWWKLSSPTHGEFVGFDSFDTIRVDPRAIGNLVSYRDQFSIFASGANSWSVYYASDSWATNAPEPAATLLLIFAPMLSRIRRKP